MKRKAKKDVPIGVGTHAEWTVQDFAASLQRRLNLMVECDGLVNSMEREKAAISAEYGPDIADVVGKMDLEEKRQLAWMVSHKADFDGPPRSLSFPCATVGYRLGQEHLKPLSKWTWDKVLEHLIEIGQEEFIRRPPEVDREKLLAHKNIYQAKEWFASIGLKVVQDDKPFIEIKRDQTADQVATVEGAA